MCRSVAAMAVLGFAGMSAADVWSPMDFYLELGNPKAGDTQKAGAMWTFRTGAFNGPLMTGFNATLICEPGFGLWGTVGGPYGFIPNVGPRVSPAEGVDQVSQGRVAEFDGLLVIPSNDQDACLVFTASGPITVPTLTLRGEMLYGSGDGVLLSVKTRISGQTKTWLDGGEVPDEVGSREWTLFQNQHPELQKGDKLWIEVNRNGDYSADWTNVSLTSGGCYADCTGEGTLDLFDFLCFVNSFNANEGYADCDGNGPRDLFDFLCFVNEFNAGC